MDPALLDSLLSRLERGAHETSKGMKTGMTLVGALFVAFAVFSAAQQSWAVAGICLAFSGGIFWIGHKAARNTAPEKMLPVIAALREAPESITLVRHYQTSDSRRVFVTDWIEVRTAKNRLLVKAKQDWQALQSMLHQRCPQAQQMDR